MVFSPLDLKGQKFGKLTAIEITTADIFGNRKWLCECECGNKLTVLATRLKNGHVKNCPDCRYLRVKEANTKYKVGDKIKIWTIISRENYAPYSIELACNRCGHIKKTYSRRLCSYNKECPKCKINASQNYRPEKIEEEFDYDL